MAKNMFSRFVRRLLYGASGVLGAYMIYLLFARWAQFYNSMGWGIILYILSIIFLLNWFPVALNGNGDKDLLHYIGLKK